MPGVIVSVGGNVGEFVAAMKTVEKVAMQSGSVAATELRKAEVAILAATNGTKLGVHQLYLYEAALQKVRGEIKSVESAEVSAGNAAKHASGLRAHNAMNGGLSYLTGSQVTRDTGQSHIIADLRRKLLAGGKESDEARAEIRRRTRLMADSAGSSYTGPRRARGFGGASSAMFISVARDSAASLASGANPLTVFMQQAPQVAQAFTMMGKSVMSVVRAILPFAGIAAALLGIGFAAYRVHKFFKTLAESVRDANNPLGIMRQSMEQLHGEMDKGAKSREDYRKWLRSLSGESMTAADKTDAMLKKMRGAFQMQADIARGRGASPSAILEMEIEQLKKEQSAVNEAREKAYHDRDAHLKQAAAAESERGSPENMAARNNIANLNASSAKSAKIADAIKKKLGIDVLEQGKPTDEITLTRGAWKIQTGGRAAAYETEQYTTTKAAEIARLNSVETVVTVDGIEQKKQNLAEANREMIGRSSDAEKLQKAQGALADAVDKSRKLVEGDVSSIKSLAKSESALMAEQALKEQYGREVAAMSGSRQSAQPLTSRQQVGAFAGGGPTITLIDLGKKQHAAIVESNKRLDKIVKAIGDY